MSQKKDIMGKILACDDGDDENLTRELDCLIYRSDPGDTGDDASAPGPPTDSWKVTKDNVSVQVWESSGRIRLRLSLGKGRLISMKQIAGIAVDAIVKELKKEDSR
ncbi:hypothetical protein [Desulfotignum balticum]|jgi:hypothetical protein|uniref:hypothetical protein n=1 Tax=Desulfotignum balticum TaxID=115781 RepID=UPI00041F079F|nr:hypothetical protein [Desulfotignum balticum]